MKRQSDAIHRPGQAEREGDAMAPSHNMGRRRSGMVVVLALLAFAVCVASSCAVKLIGDYDDKIDAGVTDLQQQAELYLSKLQSTPNTAYDQGFYDDVNARLAVLKSRASSLPKYPIIVEQITNLKSQFDDLQKLDKISPRPFPAAAAIAAESAIEISVESILRLELALKRGVSSPPALVSPHK